MKYSNHMSLLRSDFVSVIRLDATQTDVVKQDRTKQ